MHLNDSLLAFGFDGAEKIPCKVGGFPVLEHNQATFCDWVFFERKWNVVFQDFVHLWTWFGIPFTKCTRPEIDLDTS